jgi:hypothetical protein
MNRSILEIPHDITECFAMYGILLFTKGVEYTATNDEGGGDQRSERGVE